MLTREITIECPVSYEISESALRYMHRDMCDLVFCHRFKFRKSENTPEMNLLNVRIMDLETNLASDLNSDTVGQVRDEFREKSRRLKLIPLSSETRNTLADCFQSHPHLFADNIEDSINQSFENTTYVLASEFHAKEQLETYKLENPDLYALERKKYQKYLSDKLEDNTNRFLLYGGIDPRTVEINNAKVATSIGLDT